MSNIWWYYNDNSKSDSYSPPEYKIEDSDDDFDRILKLWEDDSMLEEMDGPEEEEVDSDEKWVARIRWYETNWFSSQIATEDTDSCYLEELSGPEEEESEERWTAIIEWYQVNWFNAGLKDELEKVEPSKYGDIPIIKFYNRYFLFHLKNFILRI